MNFNLLAICHLVSKKQNTRYVGKYIGHLVKYSNNQGLKQFSADMQIYHAAVFNKLRTLYTVILTRKMKFLYISEIQIL